LKRDATSIGAKLASTETGRQDSWTTGRLRQPGFLAVILALFTFAVYLPVTHNDFVNYDDADYVTANKHVQGGLTWANIAWAFTTGHASNWHPLTWLSHMMDWQMFGDRPGPQHLVSVLFHVANTVLLLLVLHRLTGAPWRSALVAGLFGLHPLHVESVAWISERKDVLSTLFLLLAIGAYGRNAKCGARNAESANDESRMPNDKAGIRRPASSAAPNTVHVSRFTFHVSWDYLLALGFFALGLMSKPMLVTTPFLLLLLDYWPLRRFDLTVPSLRARGVPLLIEKIPFLALSVLSSVVTFIVQREGGAVSTVLSLGARIANALVSYVRYLTKMAWPDDLSVLYPHPGHWPVWRVVASAAFLVVVTVVVMLAARRRRYVPVGWFWFLGTLIPVIGLVQVGIQSMADRYSYVPLIGIFIMISWGVAELVPPRPWRPQVLLVGSALLLAVCGRLTARQTGIWRDSEALFRQAVSVTESNYLAYNNLGFYYSGQGRSKEALENYQKSLAIQPSYLDALNNLGYALAGLNRHAEAVPYYEAALRANSNHVEVHNNLGNSLSELGRADEAIAHYRFVLQKQPDHANAHNNLGIALAMQGQLEEGIGHFEAAIRAQPNYASAHSNLGNAYAAQHKLDAALREYEICLKLKPDDAQAQNNMGNALAELGRLDEAIDHYRAALRLNAENPEACFNLGAALLRKGQREEAITQLEQALRLRPEYPAAKEQLRALGR
jgi:tetratricopeptide (TPR) repeat protein